MKLDQLRAIGHNIADSLADRNGFFIGHYDMRLFEEVLRSPDGFNEVDFLTGASTGGQPSAALARMLSLYSEALPSLRQKHRISRSAFRQLRARFLADRRFAVTVEDGKGRCVTDEYAGFPGRRIKTLDAMGRVRRTRGLSFARPRGLIAHSLSKAVSLSNWRGWFPAPRRARVYPFSVRYHTPNKIATACRYATSARSLSSSIVQLPIGCRTMMNG
jgi:hypothetical protein